MDDFRHAFATLNVERSIKNAIFFFNLLEPSAIHFTDHKFKPYRLAYQLRPIIIKPHNAMTLQTRHHLPLAYTPAYAHINANSAH